MVSQVMALVAVRVALGVAVEKVLMALGGMEEDLVAVGVSATSLVVLIGMMPKSTLAPWGAGGGRSGTSNNIGT